MPSAIKLSAQAKILIMRQDRIGDVFVSTPFVYALRERYPSARVDFLLSRNNVAASFAVAPAVNQIYVLKKNSFSMLMLLWKLRAADYDLVIDLNHTTSTTSNMLISTAKAKHSIVLETDKPTPATHVVPQGDRRLRHIVDVLCDLTIPLGFDIAQDQRRLVIPISDQLLRDVRNSMVQGFAGKILGIQISGSSVERMYPPELLRVVVAAIEQQFPEVNIVILSAPSDRPAAEIVIAGTRARCFDAGSGYERFAAAIASCDWLLSPDTAAIHVAAAHDVPSVVLFSRDHRGFLNWLPYGSYCLPIITEEAALSAIPADEVVRSVATMMSR